DFKEDFKILNSYLRERGEFVPPLVNIYMNLSPTMKTFGTAVNPDFGNVEETGILVTFDDIYDEKKERHVNY
ncbi:MAG: hemolysin, partial [Crocinitomicaceae bacterium]|nr:hemolysin [Crocinitomicaceae bacterium]